MMINYLKTDTTSKILIFFIALVLYINLIITNIYFDVSLGADNDKYITYIDYLFGSSDTTFNNQGIIYFYFVATAVKLIPHQYSFAVLIVNNLLFIVGLLGYFKFMQILNFKKNQNLIIILCLNFFPPLLALRMNMKPEIFAFCLIAWLLYYFESYLKNSRKFDLLVCAFLFSFLITTKGSTTGMVLLLFGLLGIVNLKKFQFKNIIILLIVIILTSAALIVENSNLESGNLLFRGFDEKYNNRASAEILFNVDLERLLKDPKKDYHKNSLISITLLDTMGDYFELNWKEDASLFRKAKKQLIFPDVENISEKRLSIDFEYKRLIYSGVGDKYITVYYLEYLGLIFSLIFYLFLFRNLFRKSKKNEKLYLFAPIIGLVVLSVNAIFGFPQNNYDPLSSDTFKTFYYAFLFPTSIIFILKYVKITKKSTFLSFCFILFFYINLGFPKSNFEEYDKSIINIVEQSYTCNVDKYFFNRTFIIEEKIDCQNYQKKTKSIDYVDVYDKNIEKTPVISLILFSILSALILFDLSKKYLNLKILKK